LGDGVELSNCKSLSKELGVSDRVHFLGTVENPYPYYKNSDFYLSCSLSEGFPNTLIESLSLDCYPLHMDCKTGPREIISNLFSDECSYSGNGFELFDLGILISENNVESICSAIKFVLKNKPEISDRKLNNLLNSLSEGIILNQYDVVHG